MKRTSIRKVSKKRSRELRAYYKLRKRILSDRAFCEAPASTDGTITCMNPATELHHVNGRNGSRLTDERYIIAICREHHRFLHDNPRWARQHNLLK